MKETSRCRPQTCLAHEIIQPSHLQNKRFSFLSSFLLFFPLFSSPSLSFIFFDNHIKFSWPRPGSSTPTIKLCENSELGQQGSFVSSCQQRFVLLGTMTAQVGAECCVRERSSVSSLGRTQNLFYIVILLFGGDCGLCQLAPSEKEVHQYAGMLSAEKASLSPLFLSLVLFHQFSPAHSPATIDV